jgi:hypothetical protein
MHTFISSSYRWTALEPTREGVSEDFPFVSSLTILHVHRMRRAAREAAIRLHCNLIAVG